MTIVIIALFSLASNQDGEIWKSGLCAGIAASLLVTELHNRFAAHHKPGSAT